MSTRPVNAMVAIVLALLPLPALKLLAQLNRGCGDGLCGFFSGILILGCLAVATVVFVARSARRSEAPAIFRWVPLLLWAMTIIPLVR